MVKRGDEVLFAHAATFDNATPTKHYLRLPGPTSAPVGIVVLTVTDGGAPFQGEGAKIKDLDTNTDLDGGGETNASGGLSHKFQHARRYRLKAYKGNDFVSIRSNRLDLVVN
jgi:hypothetical protein